jgi:hypothetical protein
LGFIQQTFQKQDLVHDVQAMETLVRGGSNSNLKSIELTGGGTIVDIRALDEAGHFLLKPGEEAIDLIATALHNGLYAAIGKIFHVTGNFVISCKGVCRVSEANTLHSSGE